MRKVHSALHPEGLVVTLEFVPAAERISPPEPAAFAMIMMMLATTAKGDAYTFAEYDEMYRNAGFARNEMHRLEGAPEAIMVSHR